MRRFLIMLEGVERTGRSVVPLYILPDDRTTGPYLDSKSGRMFYTTLKIRRTIE